MEEKPRFLTPSVEVLDKPSTLPPSPPTPGDPLAHMRPELTPVIQSMHTSEDPAKNLKNLPTIPNSLIELMMMVVEITVAKLREKGEDSGGREGLDLEDGDNKISFPPGLEAPKHPSRQNQS